VIIALYKSTLYLTLPYRCSSSWNELDIVVVVVVNGCHVCSFLVLYMRSDATKNIERSRTAILDFLVRVSAGRSKIAYRFP